MNDDLLYNVIMNPDTTILQKTVDCFVSELEKNYIGRSTRLKRMMEISKSTDNRLLKHSLIFFCLYQEPFAVSYFMKDNAMKISWMLGKTIPSILSYNKVEIIF